MRQFKEFIFEAAAAGIAFSLLSRFAGTMFALAPPGPLMSSVTLKHGVALVISYAAGEYAIGYLRDMGYLA